ncbi:hypothetical protein E4T56_gene16772 [Termitomyces sp. T112]|nr:hypothetical protein E4T56_gene16772 [Termitomyces sp. T112]
MVFCLNPAKTVPFPRNPTSLDLPSSVQITSHQLSAQAISAWNIFECLVTSARGSRPPSKDLPSAAESPRSAEPDSRQDCPVRVVGGGGGLIEAYVGGGSSAVVGGNGPCFSLQVCPPLQCSAKLPNPHSPSTPTSGNSNTSLADPDSSLINSNTFSAAVDASPEFPWTPEAFPNPETIRFPTDPIRMSLRPVPRSHPTTVDSAQFHQAATISSALQSRPVVGI